MGRVTLEQLHLYDLNDDLRAYVLELYLTGISKQSFFNAIVSKLQYYCRLDDTSFLTVYSETESKDAKQSTIKTGKRGRPKKTVIGKKKAPHVHTIFIGKHAHKTALATKNSLNKWAKKNGSTVNVCRIKHLSDGEHIHNTVYYDYRQASHIRTGGSFDFKEYCWRFI